MLRVLLLLAALLSFAPQAAPVVRPGMSGEDARALLGEPLAVSRQILAHRAVEQWHYKALRIEVDCPRGLKPRVVSVTPVIP